MDDIIDVWRCVAVRSRREKMEMFSMNLNNEKPRGRRGGEGKVKGAKKRTGTENKKERQKRTARGYVSQCEEMASLSE